MAKQDLDRLYASEVIKYNALYLKETPLTTTGSLSFTSTSSSATYNSSTGEQGLLTALQTALANYLASANDINDPLSKIGTLANLNTTNKIDLVQAINSHLAENATDAHNATAISVADTGNHFTATNVETVLAELFTFANDGKTGEANVIGSPALSTDSFATLNGLIQTNKNTLAINLTNKGQSSAGTETLANLVAKVANVNTGKKFATGNVTASYNTVGWLDASGLSFTPKYVLFHCTRTDAYKASYGYATTDTNMLPDGAAKTTGFSYNSGSYYGYLFSNFGGYMTSGSFHIPVDSNLNFDWIAIE